MSSLKISSLIPTRPASLRRTLSSSNFGSGFIEDELEKLGLDITRLAVDMPRSVAWLTRQSNKLPFFAGQRELFYGVLRQHYAGVRTLPPENLLLAFYSSEVEPPRRGLYATFEDMTVRQAIDHGAYGYGELARRQAEAACERQKRWYQGALVCFAQSQWAADSIVNDFGVSPESVLVVGQKVPTTSRQQQAIERDWSVPRFLFVGLDWERKNGARVVEGFRSVRSVHPNAELHLVGRVPDVHEPGVTSHGFLDHAIPEDNRAWQHLLSTCTCLAMPSLIEPGGTAHAEALISGVPVIGTDVGGNREVIGRAGIVVTPTDQREITDAMLRMCSPDLARSLGSLGPESEGIATAEEIAVKIRDGLMARLPRGD